MKGNYRFLLKLLQKPLLNTKPNIFSSPKHFTTLAESNSPESPDLPTWLVNQQNPHASDDFIIPSLAEWVQNPTPNKLPSLKLFENSDVDKLCATLNKHYSSKDGVIEALNETVLNVDNGLVLQVLKRFSSDWVSAYGFFTWAKRRTGYAHSVECYNLMVDVLGKCRMFSLMWEIVDEMNTISGFVTSATMSKVIRRLAKSGNYNDAVKAFEGMEERFGLRKDVESLNVLMDALVKEGSVELAHNVFRDYEGVICFNVNSYNILIHGYCKARKLEEAKKVMEEMEKHGFEPSVVSYTSFIELYCRERDFRKVDSLMEEMEKKGCEPSVVTYTIVMHSLGKAKQINEALEVYEKMKAKGCVPDSPFYSSLIFILCKSGRLKDAWDVFEDMKAQGISRDTLAYNTMISCVCSHSQYENGIKLLLRMEKDKCKPDISTYDPLLKLCCRKNTMKLLGYLLDHMSKNDVCLELGSYALLVLGFCQSGKHVHACYFFEEMVLKGMVPYNATYKTLVQELEKKNETEAKERVEKLMLLAKERVNVVPT